VDLSWINHSAGSATIDILRSEDGTNYDMVGVAAAGATTGSETGARLHATNLSRKSAPVARCGRSRQPWPSARMVLSTMPFFKRGHGLQRSTLACLAFATARIIFSRRPH
jgi:hypothetical protein